MKLGLADFAAGLRNFRLFRLSARQVQIPLATMIVVLSAAGAFAWQSPTEVWVSMRYI